jgi:hypothetical protein
MKQRFYVWLWQRLPLAEREAFVGMWISNRARRRAALGPFPRAFEDEINNAGVDMVRDFNRASF